MQDQHHIIADRIRIPFRTMQCCGSGMFIPDPGSDFFPSRIPVPNRLHPGSRILIKEFKYFNPKKTKKWFLSSKKYDPGWSSQIPDPDADFLPIPDPGSRGQKGTQSRIPDPEHWDNVGTGWEENPTCHWAALSRLCCASWRVCSLMAPRILAMYSSSTGKVVSEILTAQWKKQCYEYGSGSIGSVIIWIPESGSGSLILNIRPGSLLFINSKKFF